MADEHGEHHHYTLPIGKMKREVWQAQMQKARDSLPPQFVELVVKTKQPFVQAITDVKAPKEGPSLMDGKVIFCGDALSGFRPHTAASTSQAAFDALMLRQYFKGIINADEWTDRIRSYAKEVQRVGGRQEPIWEASTAALTGYHVVRPTDVQFMVAVAELVGLSYRA